MRYLQPDPKVEKNERGFREKDYYLSISHTASDEINLTSYQVPILSITVMSPLPHTSHLGKHRYEKE